MTEQIKIKSNYLRGTLANDLQNQLTGSLTSDNHQLIKFHGIYEQDNRDRRKIRAEKKLEKDYFFMIRLRIAGGRIDSKQWLGIVAVANQNSTGVIKITTRQTVQLHGVIKSKLKPTVKYFDQYGLDSIATCGDVNRNVMSSAVDMANPSQDKLHALAVKISDEFLPKTNAYKEIWLDGEPINKEDVEPIYGKTYLPRKFKIVLALPPFNDVDVFAHDIGLIAIEENNKIEGFNVVVGGGMGMTHGNNKTYARVGDVIGYVDEIKILEVIKNIITIQREFGNRQDRKQARLKYTIDRLGLDWFVDELQKNLGFELQPQKPFEFRQRADEFGWRYEKNTKSHFTLFVENGLVQGVIKDALIEIATKNLADFCFTNNQNIIISNVCKQIEVDKILSKYQLSNDQSKTRKNSMACVAFNTCPLALAEGQRYLPVLLDKVEELLIKHSLQEQEISIRMTGCPNGCARPYLAEIGLVGKSLGRYNLYLAGSEIGSRLNVLYKESLNEAEILIELDWWFQIYSKQRIVNESFGNFTFRTIKNKNGK
jgi:sulfite reductase (NADPH) hemoprotein beta-component